MQLAQWTSIFGSGDGAKSSSESDEDDESRFWFSDPVESSQLQRRSTKPLNGTCDSGDSCRNTGSGICVDCTCCTNHCKCCFAKETEVFAPLRVFDCNPATCKQLVCGQCTRCIDHCTCKWDLRRLSSDTRSQSDQVDANRQALRNKFSWVNLRRKGEF
jgi:hypothetical protein